MGGCGVEGKGEEARAGFGRLPCGRDGGGGLPFGRSAITGERKGKGCGEEGKGDGSAVEWDQRRSERKGRTDARVRCGRRPSGRRGKSRGRPALSWAAQ